MVTRRQIEDFLNLDALAVVGVSRKRGKFGSLAFRELKSKGIKVFPVHPSLDSVDGVKCSRSLGELSDTVQGVLIVVSPDQAVQVVLDAAAAGIRQVWLQQGAESPEVLRLCREHGIDAIHGECILMFVEPTGFVHRIHRGAWRLLGKLPA